MSDGIDKSFEILEKLANESTNRMAFFDGMVVGLAHALNFTNDKTIHAGAAIATLVELIDERIYKPLESNPQ